MAKKSRVLFESEIGKLLESRDPVDLTIHRFTRLLSEYLDDSVVSLFLYEQEEGQLFLKSTSLRLNPGSETIRFTAAGTISSLAIGEGRSVSMQEISRPGSSSLQAGYHVFPMQEGEETLGVVTIERVAPRGLGVVQLDVARRSVGRLSGTVAAAKKEADLSLRMTKISAINEAGVTLLSHKELSELLKTSTAVAALIMGAGSCVIRIYDDVTGAYVPRDCYGLAAEDLRSQILHLDRLVTEKVISGGKPVVVRDLSRRREYGEFDTLVRTLLCHPLKAGKDVVGTITLFNKNTGSTFAPPYYTDEDLVSLARLSKYVEKAVVEAMADEEKKELQERDEVTGLPDMKYFGPRLEAEISRAGRFGSRMVILACETGLRPDGDSLEARSSYRKMIRRVAEAIKGSLRQYDIIASLSEGRFVMILPQAEDGTVSASVRVERAVGRALERIGETREGALPEIRFSKVIYPDDGENAESLMEALRSS